MLFDGPNAEPLSPSEQFLGYVLTEPLMKPRDRLPPNYNRMALAIRCHSEKRVGRFIRFAGFAEQLLNS